MGVKATLRGDDTQEWQWGAKRAKTSAQQDDSYDYGNAQDEEWDETSSKVKIKAKAKAKAQTKRPKPEDLEPGTVVLYWGGWRGIVRDAFFPLDEFWISEEESGEIVRDDNGEIVQFKSAELELIALPPVAKPMPGSEQAGPAAGVLLLGTEAHMMKILEHFGSPDPDERNNPQQLLAIPCSMCDAGSLLATAAEGVDAPIRKLAEKIRPDIHVALRAFHLKQAIEQMGPDLLRMEGYYCLSAVQIPYSLETIKASTGWEKHWQKDVCNQIDLCVTARGWRQEASETIEGIAGKTLGETCGLSISGNLWSETVQTALRRRLKANVALQFTDANAARILVLILPEECTLTDDKGILVFCEPKGADYSSEATGTAAAEAAPEAAPTSDELPENRDAAPAADEGTDSAASQGNTVGGKTIAQWETEQDLFKDEPKLPAGWLRIKSRSSGEVYFFNKRTQESTFEWPLPEGWTKQVSKSTGKTYYFHAKKKQSTFERPTA